MKGLEELYYLLGRLESIKVKDKIRKGDLYFIQGILEKNQIFKNSEDEFDSIYENPHDYDDGEPIMIGDARYDRSENPWIDVFGEGEEAEAAYWNTD